MSAKNTSVFGIYPDRPSAEEAVGTLCAAGFRHADVSVLFQENQGTKDFAHEKNTKAPEGTVAGGIIGCIIGGALGWLVSVGTLSIPQLDPLRTAGPIIATLAGLGAAGLVGAIIGALAGMGLPEYEARRFVGRIRRRGALLSVHCDNRDWVKRAKHLMRHTGGEGIGSEAECGADFSISDKPMLRQRKAIGVEESPLVAGPPLVEKMEKIDPVQHELPQR